MNGAAFCLKRSPLDGWTIALKEIPCGGGACQPSDRRETGMERSDGGTHQANPGENGPSSQDDGEGNKAIQPTHERELPAEQIPVTERERE